MTRSMSTDRRKGRPSNSQSRSHNLRNLQKSNGVIGHRVKLVGGDTDAHRRVAFCRRVDTTNANCRRERLLDIAGYTGVRHARPKPTNAFDAGTDAQSASALRDVTVCRVSPRDRGNQDRFNWSRVKQPLAAQSLRLPTGTAMCDNDAPL